MRYLVYEQLGANLSIGKSIEQWLPPDIHPNYIVLRMLTISKERNSTYATSYVEYFDEGNEKFTDVYAFTFLNPDEPELLNNFNSVDEALQFVLASYNATPDKFVTQGMIQDEYKDYLKTRDK